MKRIVLALAAFVLVAGTSVSAQNFKAAFVNSETIMKELPEAQTAMKKIEDATQKVRDTLQMMQKDFETRFDAYRKQMAMMSADAKNKEEEALNNMRTRFVQYQDDKTNEMRQVQEAALKPIRDKVTAAIADIAKEEKISMVLDKVAGMVLFSEDKADITYKVLDKMKRGEK